MPKRAVSVTLAESNLLWLRGQVRAATGSSLSAVLDALVSEARSRGRVHEDSVRSVVGTVAIAERDPDLRAADAAVRALFPAQKRAKLGAGTRRGTARSGG